jgi:hypothetical protein
MSSAGAVRFSENQIRLAVKSSASTLPSSGAGLMRHCAHLRAQHQIILAVNSSSATQKPH